MYISIHTCNVMYYNVPHFIVLKGALGCLILVTIEFTKCLLSNVLHLQSIVGRVTDAMKDMISPSWLVDLVSTIKKKTPPMQSSGVHQQHEVWTVNSLLFTFHRL